MRNIAQYPITSDEASNAIATAREAWVKEHMMQIGSTNGFCLYLAEKFILANKDAFDKFASTNGMGE